MEGLLSTGPTPFSFLVHHTHFRWVEKEHGASLSSLWSSLKGLGLSAWTLLLQLGQVGAGGEEG